MSKIIIKGKYNPKDIFIYYQKISNRKIDVELEENLERTWGKVKTKAKKQKRKIWDSTCYRLDDFKARNSKIEIRLSTIRFRKARSINYHLEKVKSLGEDYYGKSIFVSTIIHTKDRKYIISKLSSNYMVTRDYDLVGGTLVKDEKEISNSNDLFDALFKELEEETGVTKDTISNCFLIGAILTEKTKVGFIFKCYLRITSTELLDIFTCSKNDELDTLIIQEKDEFYKFLNDSNDYKQKVTELL